MMVERSDIYHICQVWDEITYPFSNFNGAAVEVWKCLIFLSHTLLGMWLLIHAGIKVICVCNGARPSADTVIDTKLNVIF